MKRNTMMIAVVAALLVVLTASVAFAATRVGNDGPNRLVGTAQNDTLRGLGGNDRLRGLGDSDRLFGNGGRDVLLGGNDSDRMVGGKGNDRINAGEPGRLDGDTINCGPGRDVVINARPTEDIIRANCEVVRR